jgi:hypothetical protein
MHCTMHMEQITYMGEGEALTKCNTAHTCTYTSAFKFNQIYIGRVACVCLHIFFFSHTNLLHNRMNIGICSFIVIVFSLYLFINI